MAESLYHSPSEAIELRTNEKTKSLALTFTVCIVLGPFVAMLYLARPIRAAIYLATGLLVSYKLTFGVSILVNIADQIALYVSLTLILVGLIDSWFIYKKLSPNKSMPLYSRWYVVIPTMIIFTFGLHIVRGSWVELFKVSSRNMLPNYSVGEIVVVDRSKSAKREAYGIRWDVKPGDEMYEMVKRGNVVMYRKDETSTESFQGRIIGIPNDRFIFTDHNYQITNCDENGCTEVPVFSELIVEDYELPRKTNGELPPIANLYKETVGSTTFNVLHFDYEDYAPCLRLKNESITVPIGYVLIMGDNRDNSFDSRFFGVVAIENLVGENR